MLTTLAYLTLFCLELTSVAVYFDLWLVINKKRHFYEPLLKCISVGQRKVYQHMYRQSLLRQMLCASDKVDVSGTTFNTVLLVANVFSFLINMYDSVFSNIAVVNHFWLLLWLHALIWTTYLQFVVYAYRGAKELCFYCTWVLIFEFLHVVILNYLCGLFCYVLYLVCGLITTLVLLTSQAARMDRKYKMKQEKKDRQERER